MVHPAIPAAAEQPNLLNGLVAKRAELAGRIEANQAELRDLVVQLDSIESTIRIFNPDIDLDAIQPRPVPPKHAAFKGEVTRIVFDCLREAEAPMTSRDIALALIAWRRLNPDDRGLVTLMTKRVGACLKAKQEQKKVRSLRTDGPLLGWELVR